MVDVVGLGIAYLARDKVSCIVAEESEIDPRMFLHLKRHQFFEPIKPVSICLLQNWKKFLSRDLFLGDVIFLHPIFATHFTGPSD